MTSTVRSLSGIGDVIAAARGHVSHDAPAVSFDAEKRSVLVTGATGFIGQRLVRALLPRRAAEFSLRQDGQQVVARVTLRPPAVRKDG